MKSYILLSFLFCLLFTFGCKSNVNNYTELNGWWVSKSLFDSIQITKSIYANKTFLDQDAIFLLIEEDSVETFGTIINSNQHLLTYENDTIGEIGGMLFADLIHSDSNITASTLLRRRNYNTEGKMDSIKPFKRIKAQESFRRANEIETEFIEKHLNLNLKTHEIYEKWFAKQILAGNYIELENNNTITLSSNQECDGFKEFNGYKTHITNGTLDWNANDWIKFWNTETNEYEVLHYVFQDSTIHLYEYYNKTPEEQSVIGKLKYSWRKNN